MKKTMLILKRVRITGKIEERQKALDWLNENKFRITSLGPKYIGKMRVDVNRFVIVAERLESDPMTAAAIVYQELKKIQSALLRTNLSLRRLEKSLK